MQKKQSGQLDDAFFASVLSKERTEAILNGRAGATIREHNNVAKYYKISSRELLEQPPVTSPERNCEYCGNLFIPAKPKAVYCSDSCRNKAFREKN